MLRIVFVLLQLALWLLPSATAAWTSTWWAFPPFLGAFGLFAAAMLAIGARIERRLGGGWGGVFLYSSLLLCMFPMLLGQLGWLHARWLFGAVALMGTWLLPELRSERLRSGVRLDRGLRWLAVAATFVLFVRTLSAFLPSAHGDPLLYHLVGPKLWVEMGKAKLFPDLPIPLLSSTWEYLYVWPQEIWSKAEGMPRMIAAQVFSQWMHLLWGWVGCGVVLFALLRERERRFYHAAAAVGAALLVASVQWPAALAKNDTGVAFWAFGAILCTRWALVQRRAEMWLLAGVFAGLAVIGKLNAGLFLAGGVFLLYPELLSRRWEWKRILLGVGLGACGAVLAMLPVLWRNYSETGNPFYPLFPQYFPTIWVTESWAHHFSSVHPKDGFDRYSHLLYRLRYLFLVKESPFIFGWLLLPLFVFGKAGRELLLKLLPWILFSVAILLLFVVGFNGEAELRYLGAGLMGMAVVGTLSMLAALESLPWPGKFGRYVPLLLVFVVMLAASKLPTHLLWKARDITPGEAFLLTHTAGDSKEWIRRNVGKEDLVILVADNESYYLSDQRVTVLTERPDLDKATYGVKDFGEFVRGICATSQAKFLLDARPAVSLLRRFPELERMDAAAFRGNASVIYDLGKIDAALSKGKPYGCASSK